MSARGADVWYRYWARPEPAQQAVPDAAEASPVPDASTASWPGSRGPARGPDEADIPIPPVILHAPPPPGGFHVERLARVLVVANQKGGVGKTTTAVSLAAALSEEGRKVLLLDLDPQGNASSGVGLRAQVDGPTIYEVLVDGADVREAVVPTAFQNLWAIPATIDLAGAEIELVAAFNRERRLRHALEPLLPEFDVIIIDCPPSLGLLTVNALSAGDGVVVPIQCEYFALEGLGALRRNTDLIRAQLNPELEIVGFVLTMLDARTRLSQQVVDEVRTHFGDLVFATRIPRSVRLAEAPGFGQPITVFDPASRGAMAYRNLALEVIDRITPAPTPARVREGARP